MPIADLHIHSRFSRATSADCDLAHLDQSARKKGIHLVGTGDFTHPAWREELANQLEQGENGLYRLKKEFRLPDDTPGAVEPFFVISGEISTIYKKSEKTRKVHHLIILPDLEAAEDIAAHLEAIGNLHSDGRPILGLDSRDLVQIVMDCCPRAIFIPAHIWTPHFSLFGAFSQFSTVEECFEDMTPCIHAMETGLSSDPPMNRLLSMLDPYQLISNSDAHSPGKLGREGNLLSCDLSYDALKTAIETGNGLTGTLEFYPEEGKYHLDGHRNCHCRLEPSETRAAQGRCPVCGKKVTVGVLNRVMELADRKEAPPLPQKYESLIPLPELIGETLGVSAESKKAREMYLELLQKMGPEFHILREAPLEDAEKAGGPLFKEALRRMRCGEVRRIPGYDGEYGVIRLFQPGEKEALLGQTTLLTSFSLPSSPAKTEIPPRKPQTPMQPADSLSFLSPNEQQQQAVRSDAAVTAVIAGPGTGKTKTLIDRIAYLIEEKKIRASQITAVTFTRQAALEMEERLQKRLGKKALKGLTLGTFHSVCLKILPPKTIASVRQQLSILEGILKDRNLKMKPAAALKLISQSKNGLPAPEIPEGVKEAYQQELALKGLRDLDDVLLEALTLPADQKRFCHLLVDEYQDINGLQRLLTRHWCQFGTLFVIGDPDQSIYGFRGADADCFDTLKKDFPQACLIRLEKNYRSAPAIVNCALQVIGHNPGEQRMLTPTRPEFRPIRLCKTASSQQEADLIVREILRLTGGVDMLSARNAEKEGEIRAFSEIAVLARTRRQLEIIEAALRKESIPCLVYGRGDFMESEECRGMLAFFSALARSSAPDLALALQNLWHLGDGLISQAQSALFGAEGIDLAAVRKALNAFDGLSPFLRALDAVLPKIKKDKPRKLLETLAEEADCKGKNVKMLLDTAVFYSDMASLLSDLETGEESDIRRASGGKLSGAVNLMTLHAAKGLEFPAVILAGLDEDTLPLKAAVQEENTEEERRLLFVGITRAREELIFTCGSHPSPFVSELPDAVQIENAAFSFVPKVKQLSLF